MNLASIGFTFLFRGSMVSQHWHQLRMQTLGVLKATFGKGLDR